MKNEHQRLYRLVLAALFAAAIAVTTAYLLHIPIPTGGSIHLGDALIYLAACLLPVPFAVGAAAVGAGLADLLTAPMWVIPTLIIKAIVVLPFTRCWPASLPAGTSAFSAPGMWPQFSSPASFLPWDTAWPPAF